MSWDIRRLGLAIENAALMIACTWLLINGWRWVPAIALGIAFIKEILFAWDWDKHGRPRR